VNTGALAGPAEGARAGSGGGSIVTGGGIGATAF